MIEIDDINPLIGAPGFWYVATPYTRYPLGHPAAYQYAKRISETLDNCGIAHFSPIVIGHEVSIRAGIDNTDDAFWLSFCRPFLLRAYGLLVVKLANWDKSRGVLAELESIQLRKLYSPVYAITPEVLLGFDIERQLSFDGFTSPGPIPVSIGAI